jgi:hypothetical protein
MILTVFVWYKRSVVLCEHLKCFTDVLSCPKTIDSIVPVVITSLKAKHPGPLELQIGEIVLSVWSPQFI